MQIHGLQATADEAVRNAPALTQRVQLPFASPLVDQGQGPRLRSQKPRQLRWRAAENFARTFGVGFRRGQNVQGFGQDRGKIIVRTAHRQP